MFIKEFFAGTLSIFIMCTIFYIAELMIKKTKMGFIPIATLSIILTTILGKIAINAIGGL